MNKKQMVKALSLKTGMTLAQSNSYLDEVLGIISKSLKGGEDVFLRGFGSFMIKERKPRRTGFFEKSLLVVAIGTCLASLVTGVILMYF